MALVVDLLPLVSVLDTLSVKRSAASRSIRCSSVTCESSEGSS